MLREGHLHISTFRCTFYWSTTNTKQAQSTQCQVCRRLGGRRGFVVYFVLLNLIIELLSAEV